MLGILQHAHSGIRWIILILLIVSIIGSFTKRGNTSFTDSDKKSYLFTMIFTHIQVLLGAILYFLSPKVQFTAETMKNAVMRFYAIEHSTMMLLAIILITIGYSRSKKADTVNGKHKAISIFYTIALLLILAGIPWPFREGLGAGWF